jgi:hypothetical protein
MSVSKVETVLVYYSPVWRVLKYMLSLRDLYLMSLTSKSFRHLVKPHLDKMCDINGKLEQFVCDPISFRSVIRDTGSVIAGEFARRFFLGVGPIDLELVLPDPRSDKGSKMNTLLRYLRYCEGYKKLPFISIQRGLDVSILVYSLFVVLTVSRFRRWNVLMVNRSRSVFITCR